MHILRALPLLVVLLPATAQAAWPDDVSLSALGTVQGEAVTDTAASRTAYETVVRELGTAIANKPLAPAETLGLSGLHVALTQSVSFLDAWTDSESNPAPWERVHPEEDPAHVMWTPGVAVRKGLPLSLEVGANLSYVAFSRQAVLGGYGRWGLVEGYRAYPDVSIQLGYSSYIGNDELDLGVMDGSMSIGYTLPFGRKVGINEGSFAPYGGVGLLWINARPQMSGEDQESLGVRAVSGFGGKDSYAEGFRPANLHLGFQLRSGDFQVLASTTVAPRSLTTANVGLGYVY